MLLAAWGYGGNSTMMMEYYERRWMQALKEAIRNTKDRVFKMNMQLLIHK